MRQIRSSLSKCIWEGETATILGLQEYKGFVGDLDACFQVWKAGLRNMGSNGADDMNLASILALTGCSISATDSHSKIGLMPLLLQTA